MPSIPHAVVRATVLCAAAVAAVAVAMAADASEPVPAAAPSPFDGLRLFLTPEQRAEASVDGVPVPPVVAAPVAAPAVAAPARVSPSSEPPGAGGRATVRGRRGVQRIEHGVPRRGMEP